MPRENWYSGHTAACTCHAYQRRPQRPPLELLERQRFAAVTSRHPPGCVCAGCSPFVPRAKPLPWRRVLFFASMIAWTWAQEADAVARVREMLGIN